MTAEQRSFNVVIASSPECDHPSKLASVSPSICKELQLGNRVNGESSSSSGMEAVSPLPFVEQGGAVASLQAPNGLQPDNTNAGPSSNDNNSTDAKGKTVLRPAASAGTHGSTVPEAERRGQIKAWVAAWTALPCNLSLLHAWPLDTQNDILAAVPYETRVREGIDAADDDCKQLFRYFLQLARNRRAQLEPRAADPSGPNLATVAHTFNPTVNGESSRQNGASSVVIHRLLPVIGRCERRDQRTPADAVPAPASESSSSSQPDFPGGHETEVVVFHTPQAGRSGARSCTTSDDEDEEVTDGKRYGRRCSSM
ncbi:hypothetical protein SPI_04528 [Niveomyces insectorum RCEF 264]|uniref:Uncharacterized protein n=1 Tax=Niveomyces insectorum RCEF 264 TaxID=1081102 RepID=A0A167UKN5_9HYPO|nr:hypothetical protein SPI_04528 [Niveomyces insectorum RCEF 264]